MATFDILLPVKNGIEYLAEAADSILHQTFRDWRLLILDHGSTDGSFELAQTYADRDSRVQVYSLPWAEGLAGLLNAGLDLCDCKYVLRQDADDISLPERMAVLARVLDAEPSLTVIGSLGDVVNARGEKIGILDMPGGARGVRVSTPFRTPIAHPTVAMRLDAIWRLGARYGIDFIGAMPEHKRIRVPGLAEDYFLFGQLALVTNCRNIGRGLIRYRWHGANVGAARYVDQTQLALDISRYLVNSLAIMHDVDSVDPAPFCNHGLNLLHINGRNDFSVEYDKLERFMRKVMPESEELRRELSYRKAISNRSGLMMGARYLAHAVRHGAHHVEWRTVRSWLIRDLKKQPILTLTPTGLTA